RIDRSQKRFEPSDSMVRNRIWRPSGERDISGIREGALNTEGFVPGSAVTEKATAFDGTVECGPAVNCQPIKPVAPARPAAATIHGTADRHAGRLTGGIAGGSAPLITSSISTRASPIACSRSLGSFLRQRTNNRRIPSGVELGNAIQSGSDFRIVA